MQLLSLLTSFLLFIRASLVKKKININNNIKATKQNKSEQENGTLIETDKTEQTCDGTSRCLFWSKDSHVRLPQLLWKWHLFHSQFGPKWSTWLRTPMSNQDLVFPCEFAESPCLVYHPYGKTVFINLSSLLTVTSMCSGTVVRPYIPGISPTENSCS